MVSSGITDLGWCNPELGKKKETELQEREKTAREKYPSITIGKSSYGSNGKALIMGDRDGMVKLIFEGENKRLIGAHIIGVGAPDLIPFFSLALNQKNTLTELAKTIFPHPILAEVIKEAIENAQSV